MNYIVGFVKIANWNVFYKHEINNFLQQALHTLCIFTLNMNFTGLAINLLVFFISLMMRMKTNNGSCKKEEMQH